MYIIYMLKYMSNIYVYVYTYSLFVKKSVACMGHTKNS